MRRFHGFFTLFESGSRTDAVIQKASGKPWAKIEWEWAQAHLPTVNELKKLAKAAIEDAELLVYIGYSKNIDHAKNIKTIKKVWQNIDKPLIAFLVTYCRRTPIRHFNSLQTHYLKSGTHKMVREQPALPWQVKDTVWHLLAKADTTTDKRSLTSEDQREDSQMTNIHDCCTISFDHLALYHSSTT